MENALLNLLCGMPEKLKRPGGRDKTTATADTLMEP